MLLACLYMHARLPRAHRRHPERLPSSPARSAAFSRRPRRNLPPFFSTIPGLKGSGAAGAWGAGSWRTRADARVVSALRSRDWCTNERAPTCLRAIGTFFVGRALCYALVGRALYYARSAGRVRPHLAPTANANAHTSWSFQSSGAALGGASSARRPRWPGQPVRAAHGLHAVYSSFVGRALCYARSAGTAQTERTHRERDRAHPVGLPDFCFGA